MSAMPSSELSLDGLSSDIYDNRLLPSDDVSTALNREDSAAVAPWLVQDADEPTVSISLPLCYVFETCADTL